MKNNNNRNNRNFTDRRDGAREVKVCAVCVLDDKSEIHYRNVAFLSRFIAIGGRILSSRVNGLCAGHQRLVRSLIKLARHMALLPFCPRHKK